MVKNQLSFLGLLSALLFGLHFSAEACNTAPSTNCPGFRTQTQGGWGSCPSGNNPGMYLRNNFAVAFPNGIEIGCTNKYRFTSALAVQNFLPSGGTAKALPTGVRVNPTGSLFANVFAGQVLALTISVGMDNAIPSFGSSSLNLKDLKIRTGTFAGWTIQMLLDEANKKLGGCASSYSFSSLNDAVARVNESYVDGRASGSFLGCPDPTPPPCTLSAILQQGSVTHVSCYDGSNGSITVSQSGGTGPFTYTWSNGATTKDISGLSAGFYKLIITDSKGCTTSVETNVLQPEPLTLNGTVTNRTSCQCNGTASVTATGGTEPYSYAWSNGASGSSSIGSLCEGPVSVTVTDAKGCTSSLEAGVISKVEGCYGTDIMDFNQGPRADGSPVDADRSNPELAKGKPENTNTVGTFYSLGFGGSIVIKINGGIYNKPGNDLRVVETTYWAWTCTRYEERARVFISQDGNNWVDKGQICQDGEFDIWPLPCINFVKIVDESVEANFVNEPVLADGFDVDGVECIQPAANGRMATSSPLVEESKASFNQPTWLSKSVSVYPNPVESHISLDFNGISHGERLEVSIMDHIGRVVKQLQIEGHDRSFTSLISLSDLKSGIYHVQVSGQDMKVNQKIVKK